MNKLLVITVLVALVALSVESFRVARQAEEGEMVAPEEPEPEPEQGTLGMITESVKGYYDSSVNTASGWLESVRGLKLEEKAKNIYDDTTRAVGTYSGILQDQLYHIFYNSQ